MTSIFKTLANKLFAVTDGTYDRAAMGNLDAYTGPNGVLSPAQYGFRAVDQDGNNLFDSLGLIQVMSQPGGAFAPGTVDPFVNGGVDPAVIAGAPSGQTYQLDYSVSRSVTMLQIAFVNAWVTAGPGNWSVALSTDSTNAWDADGSLGVVDAASGIVTVPLISVVSVAPGSHSVRVLGAPTGTLAVHVQGANIYAFKLGG